MLKGIFLCLILVSATLLVVEARRTGAGTKQNRQKIGAGNSARVVPVRAKTVPIKPQGSTWRGIYAMSTGVSWSRVAHAVQPNLVAAAGAAPKVERLKFPVFVKIVPASAESTGVSTSPATLGILLDQFEFLNFGHLLSPSNIFAHKEF
jgi:hypothetical protein